MHFPYLLLLDELPSSFTVGLGLSASNHLLLWLTLRYESGTNSMNDHHELSYVVVDDDEDDRMLMRIALEKADRMLPVFEFSDGQELIDYLTENAASRDDANMHWLVVMDINMPRLNGLDTLKQIRKNPYWAKLPILMLSTSDNPLTIKESLDRGANDFVTKPNSLDGYIEIFDKHFAPWLAINSSQWPTTDISQSE